MIKRIFPVINIKNKSDKEIGNLIFTYENCKYPGGVKRIRRNEEKHVQIPNKHLDYTAELIMIHRDKNGNKTKYLIEDEFDSKYDNEISINIHGVSEYGQIEFNLQK